MTDDDTTQAIRQYRGWTVTDVVTLENGTTALEIRSPDGTETTLVTPATATVGLGD